MSDQRLHLPPGSPSRPRPGGEFVLYWMQTTHRAHDNFALNYAVEQANELGLPVLVYHGLRHDYPWASDRLHTWILESVVDLYAGFEAKGIQYAFWLDFSTETHTEWPAGKFPVPSSQFSKAGVGHGKLGTRNWELPAWSPLVNLASRAALVVTDYFPTFIVPRQIAGLRRKVETPVIAVDSCTVVPLGFHTREYSTARAIRPVLMEALEHFLWPVGDVEPRLRRRVELPFDPVVPVISGAGEQRGRGAGEQRSSGAGEQQSSGAGEQQSSGAGNLLTPHSSLLTSHSSLLTPHSSPLTPHSLAARCAIDHSVAPSPMFRGGTRAGRARLEAFLRDGLPRYERDRNDPNEPDAVSRLSPWLHFGNLSIHEVLLAARKAGPEDQYRKFLDEALTWRELAHNFCHWNPKHRTPAGIPAWAREQLRSHETDPRPALYSLEELEQSRTDSPLWNACQRAYVRDGWMHNYLRMLWGKAVLQWTRNAVECLQILEHLNNKYSLDGRDPNSYGGIMWIFGKFDRPFYRRPIYGTVRYQSLRAAEGKFDVGRFVGSEE